MSRRTVGTSTDSCHAGARPGANPISWVTGILPSYIFYIWLWSRSIIRHIPDPSLTRVTQSYLSALGTTQISSYITKHWTMFPHTKPHLPECRVSWPRYIRDMIRYTICTRNWGNSAYNTYPQEKDRMKQVDTQLCVLLLVRCNTSGRLKSKAPTTHPHPQRTAVPQQNRGTYSTPARHAPTHHAHLPTMYSSTAVFMHGLLLCRIEIFHVFMIRRHYGDRPSQSPRAPFRALRTQLPALCF